MAILPANAVSVLGPESAGLLMSPEEFDAIKEYDENFHYELVQGVLVVNPIPGAQETEPNELLGYYLKDYKHRHKKGKALDLTMPQQYVRTARSRRLADRLIWAGLGRTPNVLRDVPTIAVEFVSAGRRNERRDYVDKRREYAEAGIPEYWIIDRFRRTLTVILNRPNGQQEQVVAEHETYQSTFLPGFKLPLGQLLEAADRLAESETSP